MADIDLTPTEEMASNAARGLELREKHGRGGTAVGVARARDIKNRKNLSPDTVRRMHSFFSRHEGNQAGGEDDAGYIAWLLWGGDAGQSWAKRKSAQLDKEENAMSETRKAIMERLGSAGKVKSGRAEQVMRDGTVHLDFRAAKEWLSSVTDSALRYIINDAQQAAKAMPDGNKWNYYHDLSLTAQDELQRRKKKASRPGAKAKMGKWESTLTKKHGKPIEEYTARLKGGMFKIEVGEGSGGPYAILYRWDDLRGLERIASGNLQSLMRQAESMGAKEARGVAAVERLANYARPGAKAKFAEDAREVAQEILRQLGGGRFMAMVGGKNAFHGTFGGKPGLQLDIGKGAEGGVNRLIVKLDRGSDTYDMEFWRVAKRGMDVKKVSEASGVYADDLQRIFTSRTKFYTSLSRTGEKAKFGITNAASAFLKKMLREYASMKGTRWYNEAQFILENPTEHTDADVIAAVGNLKVKSVSSRPGAKVRNAIREGEKVSASDDAVSRKIRKLMDEGKPQKQAVAIALDLERRGEL